MRNKSRLVNLERRINPIKRIELSPVVEIERPEDRDRAIAEFEKKRIAAGIGHMNFIIMPKKRSSNKGRS